MMGVWGQRPQWRGPGVAGRPRPHTVCPLLRLQGFRRLFFPLFACFFTKIIVFLTNQLHANPHIQQKQKLLVCMLFDFKKTHILNSNLQFGFRVNPSYDVPDNDAASTVSTAACKFRPLLRLALPCSYVVQVSRIILFPVRPSPL